LLRLETYLTPTSYRRKKAVSN